MGGSEEGSGCCLLGPTEHSGVEGLSGWMLVRRRYSGFESKKNRYLAFEGQKVRFLCYREQLLVYGPWWTEAREVLLVSKDECRSAE